MWEEFQTKKRTRRYRYLRDCRARISRNCSHTFASYKRRTIVCQACAIMLKTLGIPRRDYVKMKNEEDYIVEDGNWVSPTQLKVKHTNNRVAKTKENVVEGYDMMETVRLISRDAYEQTLMSVKGRLSENENKLKQLAQKLIAIGKVAKTPAIIRLIKDLNTVKDLNNQESTKAEILKLQPVIESDQKLVSEKLKVLDKAPKQEQKG